ncbi:hypothetical protein PMKS-004047 [Pichia membranifaciens]|uniref:Kri1-like C-terminal domain-containing protein n=1 Tax=Pichia membranifaciens TaxID=4926 RepID=A0A1Q2YMD0_9ASCO|nr:hypothetical protein PMKS-004047 [Pichia membranifaciens]
MPRKKSAAKIARELQKVKSPENSENKPLPLNIEDLKKELREDDRGDDSNSDEEDEEDEEEDDYGELLTENVESGLNEVLKAIKTGDQRLFDSSVNFFKTDDASIGGSDNTTKASKPVYLKEYHLSNLLARDEEKDQPIDEEKPYAIQQKEDKENLVKEIHNALGGEDSSDDEDSFLIKKEKKVGETHKPSTVLSLPDPEKEGKEKFLEAFMENHAWLPNKGEEVRIENEDDSDFDKAAEEFENAYNFRYEDPKSTEIVSYARSQATMRREKMNSRKRERSKLQEEAAREKEEVNEGLKKKKLKKMNLVMDRIKEIKEAVGDQVSDDKIVKVFGDSLMNEDFDDQEWDAKMNEIFNDEYYAEDDQTLKKPEWDDDLGMEDENYGDDIEDEEVGKESEKPEKEMKDNSSVVSSHKSEKKEQKLAKRQEKKKVKEVVERLVESKTLDILDEVQEERGRDKDKSKYSFKYREVSPESFGLTYNEIFQADDKDLNELIGLKKLAPYRPHEKASKDKRKVTKSKNMREWRKRTFGSEDGISNVADMEIKIPSIVFDNNSRSNTQEPKQKKRKSKSKGGRKN